MHSDSVTRNKDAAGAAVAAVAGGGDGGFADVAARFGYAAGASSREDVAAAFPEIEAARKELGAVVSVARLVPGEAGRVEVAVADGCAVLANITCATDLGARTGTFLAFAAMAAETLARAGGGSWDAAAALEPEAEEARRALSRELREEVAVAGVLAGGG